MAEATSRQEIIIRLADQIAQRNCDHPLRVGIDGVDAAGKTSLADELVAPLEERGRPVIRASIDGFHNPRALRYRRGASLPEGYYQDSFDLTALRQVLLIPLGPGGSRQYRRTIFDVRLDTAVQAPLMTAPRHAILLFDGIFLHRPELLGEWDFSIFVKVDFDVSVPRALIRDLPKDTWPGESEALRQRYEQRYVPGQRIYLQQIRPWEKADMILNNNCIRFPHLEEGG